MELAIKIKSCHCSDKRLDAERIHAGEVIVYKPDGWAWSPKELAHPDWVIVRVPITKSEAESLTCCEFNPESRKPFAYARQRRLNLKALRIKASTEIIELNRKSLTDVTENKGIACAH